MIIFINGSINSGKSTIAKILAEKLPKTANIEIDSLRHFIDHVEIEKAIPINLENAVLLIKNFVKHGYNVIIPYPLSEKNYQDIQNLLFNISDKIHYFTLAPDIKKAQTSTAERQLSDREYNRIQHHYDIGIPSPSFGIIIDNTNQTPEETAYEIITKLSI